MASFLKDLSSVGISKVIMVVFGLLTSIIIARSLGPEKNGVIAALVVYPSLFMTIGALGIRQSTTYYLGKKIFSEEDIKTAITQIWFLSTTISVIICYFLMTKFSKSADRTLLVFLALIPIPFNLFNTYNSGIFMGKNDIKTFNRINWMPTVVVFFLCIIFVVILDLDIPGYMIAVLSGPLSMFIILLFKNQFIHAFSFKFKWNVIRKMLSLGMVYAIALLIINLNTRLDIILLDKLSTPYEIGIYSRSAGLTQYLWQIPMLLSTIIFARSAAAKDGLAFSYKVTQVLRLSLIFVGLGLFLLFIFSRPLIIGLYGNEFEGSIMPLNLLLLGVLLLTIFKSMNQDMAGKGKPWFSLKAMIPALIVNVGLNIFLIPKYGANGAALASTISYSLAAILFIHFYSKDVGISIKEIFHFKKSDFDVFLTIKKKILK